MIIPYEGIVSQVVVVPLLVLFTGDEFLSVQKGGHICSPLKPSLALKPLPLNEHWDVYMD